jgi:predicted metal-binding membrane protein
VSAGSAAGAYSRHGLLFAGSCWALMELLFVGGAMYLDWVAALALAVVSALCPARGPKAMQYVTAAVASAIRRDHGASTSALRRSRLASE